MGQVKRILNVPSDHRTREGFAGFTCNQCPQPNREIFTMRKNEFLQFKWGGTPLNPNFNLEDELIITGTSRCRNCNPAFMKWKRFEGWFDDLAEHAKNTNSTHYFATLTRNTGHLRGDDPKQLCQEAGDFLKTIKKDTARLLRRNKTWEPYKDGLIVRELVWRRPGDLVICKSTKWNCAQSHNQHDIPLINLQGKPKTMRMWNKTVLRQCETYEAHPHMHIAGMNPGCESGSKNPRRMPYKKLIEAASNHSFDSCYIEQVPAWRMKRYLRKYLHKSNPTMPSGKTIRSRERVGLLRAP